MADRAISEFDPAESVTGDYYVPIINPDAPNAEDRNLRATIVLLSGPPTRSSSSTLTLAALNKYTHTGSGGVWTLPAGSDSIEGLMSYATNLGTGNVTINRAGSNTIMGSETSYTLYPGQSYAFYWDGQTWIFIG